MDYDDSDDYAGDAEADERDAELRIEAEDLGLCLNDGDFDSPDLFEEE